MNIFKSFLQNFQGDNKHEVSVPERKLSGNLDENVEILKKEFDGSVDFTLKYFNFNNTRAALITIDGMIDKESLTLSVMNPIIQSDYPDVKGMELFLYVEKSVLSAPEMNRVYTIEKILTALMSGFAVILMENCSISLSIGVQGFDTRGIDEPDTEVVQKGSKEGFVENLKTNTAMIRRRIRNPKLKFETLTLGNVSKTNICLCYIRGVVSEKILNEVKRRLDSVDLDTVLAAGYVVPYLEGKNDHSMFCTVGSTERPDTLCGKINEGRIAVIIDGTPVVLIVPYLFVENFQTMEDYSDRPYFATFTRWLKYIAFFIALLLPGFYVAIANFNPELFPEEVLSRVVGSISDTPFNLVTEMLLITFIYEIMREAGLRLPKALGHAVSIIGGLVIGETAVNAGLIGAPTLMIVALTAISSYVIPGLYAPIAILRLIFILAGGFFGIWGVVLLLCAILISICSKKSYGVPFASPVAPFSLFGMRDVLVRAGWKTLGKKRNVIGK